VAIAKRMIQKNLCNAVVVVGSCVDACFKLAKQLASIQICAKTTPNGNAQVVCIGRHVDITKQESINEFKNWMQLTFNRVDTLINDLDGVNINAKSVPESPSSSTCSSNTSSRRSSLQRAILSIRHHLYGQIEITEALLNLMPNHATILNILQPTHITHLRTMRAKDRKKYVKEILDRENMYDYAKDFLDRSANIATRQGDRRLEVEALGLSSFLLSLQTRVWAEELERRGILVNSLCSIHPTSAGDTIPRDDLESGLEGRKEDLEDPVELGTKLCTLRPLADRKCVRGEGFGSIPTGDTYVAGFKSLLRLQ